MSTNPSLLRFLLDRIEEEIDHVMANTPVFLPTEVEAQVDSRVSGFIAEMLDRRRLYTQLNDTKQMVLASALAMKEEQDGQLMLISASDELPVTRLGSFLLKTLAARYGDHLDYSQDWITDEKFGSPD